MFFTLLIYGRKREKGGIPTDPLHMGHQVPGASGPVELPKGLLGMQLAPGTREETKAEKTSGGKQGKEQEREKGKGSSSRLTLSLVLF